MTPRGQAGIGVLTRSADLISILLCCFLLTPCDKRLFYRAWLSVITLVYTLYNLTGDTRNYDLSVWHYFPTTQGATRLAGW